MMKTEIPQPEKLRSITGSTDTLDDLTELGLAEEAKTTQRRRDSKNLTIVLLVVFITWMLLFLGMTMYQIRSYKRVLLRKEIERVVKEEIAHMDTHDTEAVTEKVLDKIEGPEFVYPLGSFGSTPKLAEVEELKNVETKVESFLSSNSPNLVHGFEDLKFEKIGYNCYRKDFYRTNIQNSGTNLRLIAKTARIGAGSSYNFGKCATSYYWVYNNPEKNETKVYSLGPYYGHHSVDVHVTLFENNDTLRPLRLFGCQPPVGEYETDFELKRMQTIIHENAYITADSFKFSSLSELQKHLDTLARDEIKKQKEKIDELYFDDQAVKDYTALKEATSCLYSL